MKLQAHIPGQISGQVHNQAGPQLAGLSQSSGNAIAPQVLAGVSRSTINMDAELLRARSLMQEKMYDNFLCLCSNVSRIAYIHLVVG